MPQIYTKMSYVVLMILLTACGTHPSQQQLIDKYTDSESKFMWVQDNWVHYKDEGEGETLVFIHGTASSLHTWDEWQARLDDRYRVVRMDLPGFGVTGPDKWHRYEVAHDVDFIRTFLSHLGIKQAHLVGSSLGGRIAWEYALQHPDQVKTLTLINALGYPQASWPPAIQLAMLPGMETLMPMMSSRFMFSQSLNDVYFDSALITDDVIDRYFELSLISGNAEAFPKRVKARLDDQWEKIRQVSTPTLILWGQEDEYFPVANAARFAQDITHASLKVYEGVGHLPMEEIPEQSSIDLVNFIQSYALFKANPDAAEVSLQQ